MIFHIYVMRDPDTNDIRYVGASRAPQMRCYRHLSNAIQRQKGGEPLSRKDAWLLDLRARDRRAIVEIVDAEDAPSLADVTLERVWVDRLTADGADLLNVDYVRGVARRVYRTKCRACGQEGHALTRCKAAIIGVAGMSCGWAK